MGTNFYWIYRLPETAVATLPTGEVLGATWPDEHSDDPRIHIGKRSAAGKYCWDCRRTLCMGGESSIHMGYSGWHETCPVCGKAKTEEPINDGNAAGVELGFSPPRPTVPTGVRSCCSFSWAQDPEKARQTCADIPDDKIVIDEYGRELTGAEFLGMLEANCPVQFMDFIGERFS